MDNETDGIEALLPFYALGAVTQEERIAVEAYLATDPAAQRQLDAYLDTADELALLDVPRQLSPAIRDNVLNYARSPVKSTPRPRVASPPVRWWHRWQPATQFLALASLSLVLILGFWNESLRREIGQLQLQINALERQVTENEEILAMLPDSQTISIPGTESQPSARGQLIVSESGLEAVLLVSDLSSLPEDQAYQLWLIDEDGPVSQGTFSVNEIGQGRLDVSSNTAIARYVAIGVSVEPAAGSEQPTGDIVMLWQAPQEEENT